MLNVLGVFACNSYNIFILILFYVVLLFSSPISTHLLIISIIRIKYLYSYAIYFIYLNISTNLPKYLYILDNLIYFDENICLIINNEYNDKILFILHDFVLLLVTDKLVDHCINIFINDYYYNYVNVFLLLVFSIKLS